MKYHANLRRGFLKEVPPGLWSKGSADVGLLKKANPVIIRPKTEYRPCIRQYPLKPDALAGIKPVIDDLKKAGVIIPCADSPCNTPIFPVKKQPPSVGWRMVQDLQAVNNAVIQRAPCVPDPHTLLNLDLDQDIKLDILQQMQQQSPKPEQDYWIKQGAQLREGIYK